jgi:transposase
MKLIIGGSTGFVATELLSQALKNPAITSIIALGRREATLTADADSNAAKAKLKSIICDNFEEYPDSVKSELENADACIWYDPVLVSLNLNPLYA